MDQGGDHDAHHGHGNNLGRCDHLSKYLAISDFFDDVDAKFVAPKEGDNGKQSLPQQ